LPPGGAEFDHTRRLPIVTFFCFFIIAKAQIKRFDWLKGIRICRWFDEEKEKEKAF
jgi:hypothetical protein